MGAKVTVEFTGRIEIPTQGWTDKTSLDQVKKQAADEVSHWTFLVQKGSTTPVPVSFIRAKVTEVILPITGDS